MFGNVGIVFLWDVICLEDLNIWDSIVVIEFC